MVVIAPHSPLLFQEQVGLENDDFTADETTFISGSTASWVLISQTDQNLEMNSDNVHIIL